MAKGNKIVKWGVIVLAALIYLSICAIPFLNTLENADKTGILKILTVGEMIVVGVLVALLIALAIFLLKKREKVASVVKAYESETKRITWLSWKEEHPRGVDRSGSLHFGDLLARHGTFRGIPVVCKPVQGEINRHE